MFDIPEHELQWLAIRAQGAGGQHVNKVSTALQLRFDIPASSLPDALKARLLALADERISKDGVLVIKAQRFRSQEQNRADALLRLADVLAHAAKVEKPRRPTRPTRGSQQRRLQGKTQAGQIKKMRQRPVED